MGMSKLTAEMLHALKKVLTSFPKLDTSCDSGVLPAGNADNCLASYWICRLASSYLLPSSQEDYPDYIKITISASL